MSVSKTNEMLRKFIKKRKEVPKKHYFQIQEDIICEPVAEHFEQFHTTQLHKYLLDNGLFFPDAKILAEVKELERKNVWQLVENNYEKLKKEWEGTEAEIFIFPVERRNELIMKELRGKMGVSFHDVVVMFLSSELTEKEILALLTHEYNHACRLTKLNKDFDELTLLDSMVIEGMAEVAVEEIVGKELLAPWTKMYTKKELSPHWQKVQKYLQIKGKENHDLYLYGSKRGYPILKWFGYCLGYKIVKDFLIENPTIKMKELLEMDATIISKSFRIK